MNMLVASLVFIPLLAISIAHFIWAFGGSWPIRDRALLPKVVVGLKGITEMPPKVASFVVACAILGAGFVALALADRTGGGLWLTLLGIALAIVFVGRGVLGYTPRWRAVFSEEPFATLDRKNYSPLCLAIGAGFLILVLMRLL